jgi:hypothetical protein
MYRLDVWKGPRPFHTIPLDDVVDQYVADAIALEFNISSELNGTGMHAKVQKVYPDGVFFSDN